MMGQQPQEVLTAVAQEVFNRLARYQPLYRCWMDFTLWAACQAGDQDIHQRALQGHLLSDYPAATKQLFQSVYNELQSAIFANPRQNAMLGLMIALGLDERDTYMGAELSAEVFLLERAQKQHGPKATLDNIQRTTIMDPDCAVNNGSSLIAIANVIMQTFPRNFQERILFAIPEASDGFSHYMAFVQLSMMGFSAYSAPRGTLAHDIFGEAIFAPKDAICSPAFFSEFWEEARWEAFLKANGIC